MMKDEDKEVRCKAVHWILRARREFKEEEHPRQFNPPEINLQAASYTEMVDWSSQPCTEPPLTQDLTEATLHVAKGDLVLFDARLHHRGQTREYANYERRTLAGPHRMVVSITFGRNNAFSEAFERGFGP